MLTALLSAIDCTSSGHLDPVDRRVAARIACHARLAHFTRTGKADTPENTASLPRVSASPGWSFPVTSRWNRSNSVVASRRVLPFTAAGHQRGRRSRDGAARALKGHVADHVALQLEPDGQLIAAERVVPLGPAVRVLQHPIVPGRPVVLQDQLW